MHSVIKSSFILVMALLISACNKDEGNQTAEFKLSFSSNTGAEKTIKPLEVFRTIVAASAGASSLKGFLISENGLPVDVSRIKINGKNIEGNPVILYAPEDQSLRFTIEITGPSQTGVYNFSFKAFDYDNNTIDIERSITVEADAPSLKYNGPALNIVRKGVQHRYKLNGLKADGKLLTLGVEIGGQAVDLSIIKSFAGRPVTSNPIVLEITEQDNFDDDIIIVAPAIAGELTYSFILKDEYGEIGRDSASVLVGEPAEEKVSIDLYNVVRDSGTVAMSLVTGIVSSAAFSDPFIIDTGVDSTLVGMPGNWKRQIRPSNNLEVRYLRNGEKNLPQSFSYQFVETKEQIGILFENNGIPFTLKDNQGRLISDPLQPGMILVAKSGSQYFLLETVLVIENLGNNNDYYRFNLKR